MNNTKFTTKSKKIEVANELLSGKKPYQILEAYEDSVTRGYVGETILDVLTALGVHPTDACEVVKSVNIDPKSRRVKDRPVYEYLRETSIKSGGNKTDVAFVSNSSKSKTTISVISSKIGMKDPSWNQLGIEAMRDDLTVAGGYTYEGSKITINIYALVANKNVILEKISHSSSFAARHEVTLLDITDLDYMHHHLMHRLSLLKCRNTEEVIRSLTNTTRIPIRTRLSQKVLAIKAKRVFDKGEKRALIGALPRFGKTYTAAKVGSGSNAILVLTTRPTETSVQWTNVFSNSSEYQDYEILNLDRDNTAKIADIVKSGSKCIVVGSLQFFKIKDNRPELLGLTWDLAILDEIHEGGATDMSDKVISTYIGDARQLMLTATYTKPVMYYGIPEECCFFWDIEDNRLMRSWGDDYSMKRLIEKHGEDILEAMNECHSTGETDQRIRDCYTNAPELEIMTTTMQQEQYNKISEMVGSKYGFSMRALFMPDKNGTAFQNPKAVHAFFQLISGANKEVDYKNGDMSMLSRIRRFHSTKGHRNGDNFLVAMCFLPYGVGQKVDVVKKLFVESLRKKGTGMEMFDVLNLDSGMDNISGSVSEAVTIARKEGKDGLLLLTGNVGSLGVSIPEVDAAFLLHDMHSADLTYQQMMRVLTEMLGKKCGIVVDFNVWRTLTTMNSYAMSRGHSRKSSEERIHWCITNLISIDSDLWVCKENPIMYSKESIVESLIFEWRKMMASWGSTLNSVGNMRIELGNDQSELNRIAAWFGVKSSKTTIAEPDDETLQDGIQEVRSEGSETESQADTEDEKDKEREPNLNEVIARLVPEIVLLSSREKDLLTALKTITRDDAIQDAMDCFMSDFLNKTEDSLVIKGSFMSLVGIVDRNYNNLLPMRDVYEGIAATSLTIDNPKEMMEFLHGHLKPRQLEKKKNGEVFTPPYLILEQFEQLQKSCPDLWTNPNRKFLDGANGIGNYPAIVYTFLMTGLRDSFPNSRDRAKHILEKMIYMCELTPKSVEVSRKLFDPENRHKLNLLCGDFTDSNVTETWNDIKFDFIIGNPPFQDQSGNRGSAQMLWVRFVEKYMTMLNDNGFMTLIHPGGWRLNDHKLLNPMRSNQIHYLSIHDEVDGNKTFKSNTRYDWYVLQKTPVYKKTVVECQDKVVIEWDLNSLPFIPNSEFERIADLVKGDDKVQIVASCKYMHNGPWVKKDRSDEYKYPVVYSVNRQNIPKIHYASSNDRGTFGSSKVIFGSGATGFISDKTGEMGLTQFATGIADKPENLETIIKVLNSRAFRPIIRALAVGKAEINTKLMKFMRNDFYMDFIDEANREVEPEKVVRAVNYKSMKKNELVAECNNRNITVPPRSTKADMIRLLTEHV